MTLRTFSTGFLLLLTACTPLFAQVGVGSFEYVSTDATPSGSTHRTLGNASSSVKKIHVVQPGESLYRISQMYNVDMEMIKSLNNLSDNVILPNQQLVVGIESGPARGAAATSTTRSLAGNTARLQPKDPGYTTRTVQQVSYDFHEVTEGETIESIADTYDQSVDSIFAWNGSYTFAPLDVIRVRRVSSLVSFAVPNNQPTAPATVAEPVAAATDAPAASFWGTARGSAPTNTPPLSPLDAPATATAEEAPVQSWQTSTPTQTPAADENEDGGNEDTEDEDVEVPVIRTEALNLGNRQSLENAAPTGDETETEEEEEEAAPTTTTTETAAAAVAAATEETAPANREVSGNALLRQAGPNFRNAAASTTTATNAPASPPSPLDDVTATPDTEEETGETSAPQPVRHEPLESPMPATTQRTSTATATQGIAQVTPATLEEGVLETGAFAVAELPAGATERFVVYHKLLPAGTPVRILLPNSSGFVVAKVAGPVAPGNTERFALSPACVALLRAAGVTGNIATIAYK